MSKYKNYIITILTFLLSFIIQHRLVNMGLINPENLAMDLISWLVIFTLIYLIITLYLIFDYPYKYYTFKHFEV